MKYLQRLLLLLTVSLGVFSCQKEYSVENNPGGGSNSAQWSFKEGTNEFKGPIDTVGVDRDSASGYTFLTINGHSTDKRDLITLQVFGTSVKPGVYKTPFCLFAYLRNGVTLYESNQTAVDSFTITITKYDSTGITGTFNGSAWDSTKALRKIVDGKFSSVFKTTAPVTTDSGNVVVWSKAGCGGGTSTSPISVRVGGKSGQITQFSAAAPSTCDPAGSFFVKLPVGNYPWTAKCGTDSITGVISVLKNGCTKLQVDFTGSTATGDYFPLTANSNWSYLYAASTPDDTLYTFSTGNTKTFGGNAYSMFINTDGLSKDTSYYRKSGDTYWEYVPATSYTDSSGITFYTSAFAYRILVDNLTASSTYQDGPFSATATLAGNTVPISINMKSTVLETGASATIGSTSYSNIIKIRTVTSYTIAGNSTDSYAVEQWFAPGTGLIKYIDYSTPPFTAASDVLNITRAKVY